MPSQCSFKQSLTSLTVPSFLGMSHFDHCSTCSLLVYLVLTSRNVLLILHAYLCNLFGVYGRTCFPPKFAIRCGLRYVMLQLPVSLSWTDSVNGLYSQVILSFQTQWSSFGTMEKRIEMLLSVLQYVPEKCHGASSLTPFITFLGKYATDIAM